MSTRTAFLLLLSVMTVTPGCVTPRTGVDAAVRTAILERVDSVFARVFYLKPAEEAGRDEAARRLAPLLLLEAGPADETAGRSKSFWRQDGSEISTNTPTAEAASFDVFYQTTQTRLNGLPLEQITFLWMWPAALRTDDAVLPAQGIRMTLDPEGRPLLWEVLADSSGVRPVFVSQRLEARAVEEFGPAGNGRRYAVETSATPELPVVVARIIEDSPVTMGPIAYLRAGNRDVVTVNCRCMPAQARELAGMAEYRLRPLPPRPPHALRQLLRQAGEWNTAAVAKAMRLPQTF